MKIFQTNYTLSNGVLIQKVGYGTWQIKEKNILEKMIPFSLEKELRHIDTAFDYTNEMFIGPILAKFKREDYFITSKLPSHIKDRQGAFEHFKHTMRDLGLNFLDLYLIHAPWPWSEIGKDCSLGNIEVWKVLIELYLEKKIRAIGVSNFSIKDLDNIIEATNFIPHVNQICFHIGHSDLELLAYCKKHHILVEAYSPFGTGRILQKPAIIEMAKKYGVSVPQLCMRFCLQHGTLPIFKTTHEEYLLQNIDIDFEISESDMSILNSIKL